MSATICGHERDALTYVLKRADVCPGECDWKMVKLVHDPAKLAELITTEAHRRGFEHIDASVIISGPPWIYVTIAWHTGFLRTMQEARSALLRVLELPDGATAEDITKAFRSPDRADPDELLNTIPVSESLERRQNALNPGRQR